MSNDKEIISFDYGEIERRVMSLPCAEDLIDKKVFEEFSSLITKEDAEAIVEKFYESYPRLKQFVAQRNESESVELQPTTGHTQDKESKMVQRLSALQKGYGLSKRRFPHGRFKV